jgi:hypothetical protein
LDSPTHLSEVSLNRRRDASAAIVIVLVAWALFGAVEQSPFRLQGAVVEALVERGRLYFVRGNPKGIYFENLDTHTPSFRFLFNVFPHNGVYRVNHAPGQFLLAVPWYAAAVKLGWRFETHERLVWRLIVWTLTAPLGALAVVCVFFLARQWDVPRAHALFASGVFALCSPWWAASGVLYHDSIAVALILLGATLWQCRADRLGLRHAVFVVLAGALLAYSIVTTYLVVPIVLLICGFICASRPRRRELLLFGLGFLPVVAILPLVNVMSFGSPFATGYSTGGFDENYPYPLDIRNAWEKVGFYLWRREYGMLWIFPIFLLASVGFTAKHSVNRSIRAVLLTTAVVHFLFIVTMRHHGSVGWGVGRFVFPLYPILAFGLPGLWQVGKWKGHLVRVLMFGTLVYSAVFAAAAAWYGIQGVMEPGVPSLTVRLMLSHAQIYQALPVLALVAGVAGELAYQSFRAIEAASAQDRAEKLAAARSQRARSAKEKMPKRARRS